MNLFFAGCVASCLATAVLYCADSREPTRVNRLIVYAMLALLAVLSLIYAGILVYLLTR